MKSKIVVLIAFACAVLPSACNRQGSEELPKDGVKKAHSDDMTFKSPEDAFNTVLNSDNQARRHAATLHLKKLAKEGKGEFYDEQVKAYGNVLFKVSRDDVRQRVYESMGWFGGSSIPHLLVAYLTTEEKIPIKLEIVRALGETGADATQFLPAIERVSKTYQRVSEENAGKTGTLIIKTPEGAFQIDTANSISGTRFKEVADQAIAKIRQK